VMMIIIIIIIIIIIQNYYMFRLAKLFVSRSKIRNKKEGLLPQFIVCDGEL